MATTHRKARKTREQDTEALKEAKKLMATLLDRYNLAEIAGKMLVSEASARRWRDGTHAPHPGALERLRKLSDRVQQ